MLASLKSWSTPSSGSIWIFAKASSPTLSWAVVVLYAKVKPAVVFESSYAQLLLNRIWRPPPEWSQEAGTQRYQDQDLCSPRTQILHLDRWLYPRWSQHFQEGISNLAIFRSIEKRQLFQMWVSAEEYQEDPDIIHRKTGFWIYSLYCTLLQPVISSLHCLLAGLIPIQRI